MLAYVARSLARGHGYLWNGLQHCGQPVIPMTPPGTLYPFNVVFLVFGLRLGFPAMAVLHLCIGGIGTYALCRAYAAGRVASLCGALAFAFSGTAVNMATWLPSANLGTYAWLPVALYLLEGLIKRPAPPRAVALAVVLALQLFAGSPQIAWFTHQIIAFRVLWAFAARHVRQPWRFLGALAGAVVLAFGLAAVQLLPSLEFSRHSLRSFGLSATELQPQGLADWPQVRKSLFTNSVKTISLGASALAITGLASVATRGVAAFYWLLAILYVLLMFDTPLYAFYLNLPLGRAFRFPERFSYVVTFAIAVLAGLGAHTILDAGRQRRVGRYLPSIVLVLGGVAYFSLAQVSPSPWQLACLAAMVVAAGLALAPRLFGVAQAILVSVLGVVILHGIIRPFLSFQKDEGLLTRRAEAFAAVGDMMTPQDRLYQFEKWPSYSIMAKSASLFDVRSIIDYEPQTTRRYAELRVYLFHNKALTNINMFNLSLVRPPTNRPLLNLLATRYVLVGTEERPFEQWMRPPYRLRWEHDGVRVFENPDALPRAYYVPKLEVVRDPRAVLQRLASDGHRPRDVALIEEPPTDGYLGETTELPALGTVMAIEDRDEVVRLDVTATGPGFVVLTDQFFPGWSATVNGVPTPILHANYAFRAVRVPQGVSVVEFTYRPTSVRLGALLSLASLVAVGLVTVRSLVSCRNPSSSAALPRGTPGLMTG